MDMRGFSTEQQVQGDLAAGGLVRMPADWCPTFSGYYLYYPNRRQPMPALILGVTRCDPSADRNIAITCHGQSDRR